MTVYHAEGFSLTQAAVDQVRFIQGEYLRLLPGDPPVLAGISTGYIHGRDEGEAGQIVVAFWTRSEVAPEVLEGQDVVELDGIKFLFAVIRRHRPMFENAVIDYTPERAFFLEGL